MSTLASILRTLILNKIMDGCMSVLGLLHFVFFFWLGYTLAYLPLSKAPGAHDGMGLLLVLIFNLLVSIMLAALAVMMEMAMIRGFLPDWKPEVDLVVDALSHE